MSYSKHESFKKNKLVSNILKIKNEIIGFFILVLTIIHLPFISTPTIFSDTMKTLVPFLNSCSFSHVPELRDPFRFYSLCFSDHVLGNVYTIPTLSMLALLVIVFYYTKKLTSSTTYSLIAVLGVVISHSFAHYGFSATYDQTWVLLLFSSLLLLNTRFSYLAVIPFIISLGFRGLPLLDMPIISAQIIILNHTRKKKLLLIIPFILVSIISIIYILDGGYALTQAQQLSFNLVRGFESIQSYRMDMILFACAIPEILLLYKIKTKEASFILLSISYLIFQTYYLYAFSNLVQQPYRLFPLIIMISLGYSYILSRMSLLRDEIKLRN